MTKCDKTSDVFYTKTIYEQQLWQRATDNKKQVSDLGQAHNVARFNIFRSYWQLNHIFLFYIQNKSCLPKLTYQSVHIQRI